MVDPGKVLARDPEAPALGGANGQHHGAEALFIQQIIDRKVFAKLLVQFDLYPRPFDILNLFVQNVRGSRYSGIPTAIHPPATGSFSKTVTG